MGKLKELFELDGATSSYQSKRNRSSILTDQQVNNQQKISLEVQMVSNKSLKGPLVLPKASNLQASETMLEHTYAQKIDVDTKLYIAYFHCVDTKDKADIKIDKKAISNDIESKFLREIDRILLADEYSSEDKEQLVEKTIFALKCSITNIQNKINNGKDEIRDEKINNIYALYLDLPSY